MNIPKSLKKKTKLRNQNTQTHQFLFFYLFSAVFWYIFIDIIFLWQNRNYVFSELHDGLVLKTLKGNPVF